MAKIVYNACYGGFSLSDKAVLRLRELGCAEAHTEVLKGERWPPTKQDPKGEICDYDYGRGRNIKRHDPLLVQVVEELGKEANGQCAKLRIEELPDGIQYRIDEYDGNESVETRDSYSWTTAD